MRKSDHILLPSRLKRFVSAAFMFVCLFLLTGSNFILFPQQDAEKAVGSRHSAQNDPGGPVEEKPGTGTGTTLNVQEEYVHEHHIDHHMAFVSIDPVFHYTGSEALQEIHHDLLTPPPRFS